MHAGTMRTGAHECIRRGGSHLAELHDDVHHVALLIALVVLDNVGVVQAVQNLHLILGLHTMHHSGNSHVAASLQQATRPASATSTAATTAVRNSLMMMTVVTAVLTSLAGSKRTHFQFARENKSFVLQRASG